MKQTMARHLILGALLTPLAALAVDPADLPAEASTNQRIIY